MTVIEIKNVSRWYGNIVAVNDITMEIGPGVTGLLGPNGGGQVDHPAHDRRLPGAVARDADRAPGAR